MDPIAAWDVYFYDRRELFGYGGAALGYARYSSANGLAEEPGNYEAMTLQTHFRSKSACDRPTAEEVRIFRAWVDRARRSADPQSGQYDEKKVTRETAEEFGISPKRVRAVVKRVESWTGPVRTLVG